MRLSKKEVRSIKDAVSKLDTNASIYLYGSRADDSLRGGDIDLIVISEILKFSDKITILIEIKSRIGEQKIDLTVSSLASINSDPFFSEVFRTAQRL